MPILDYSTRVPVARTVAEIEGKLAKAKAEAILKEYDSDGMVSALSFRIRQKVTRPLRQKGGFSTRSSANRERDSQEWIKVPVPALVSAETFAMPQERLIEKQAPLGPKNKDADSFTRATGLRPMWLWAL